MTTHMAVSLKAFINSLTVMKSTNSALATQYVVFNIRTIDISDSQCIVLHPSLEGNKQLENSKKEEMSRILNSVDQLGDNSSARENRT